MLGIALGYFLASFLLGVGIAVQNPLPAVTGLVGLLTVAWFTLVHPANLSFFELVIRVLVWSIASPVIGMHLGLKLIECRDWLRLSAPSSE